MERQNVGDFCKKLHANGKTYLVYAISLFYLDLYYILFLRRCKVRSAVSRAQKIRLR